MNTPLARSLTRSRLWTLGPILLLAATIRLADLRLLGPFVDESGHLYAALHYDSYTLLERVQLGKVLGYFLFYPFAKWCPDPLHAARVFIACLGVLTTAGIFLTTERLGGRLSAALSAIIWASLPYVTFHDRMALHDPIVSCFAVWSLYFFITSLDADKWRWSLGAGFLLGLAVLTKAYAGVYLTWSASLALACFGVKRIRRQWPISAWYLAGIAVPCLVLLLYVGFAVFHKNAFTEQFLAPSQLGSQWGKTLARNLKAMKVWFDDYTGAPFELCSAACIGLSMFRPSRLRVPLLISFVLSTGALAVALKVIFARYLVPSLAPLVVLVAVIAGESLARARELFRGSLLGSRPRGGQTACPDLMKRRHPGVHGVRTGRRTFEFATLVSLLLVAIPLGFAMVGWAGMSVTMLSSPLKLKLPPDDAYQYLTGWTSGTGFAEAVSFLTAASQRSTQKILIVTGQFGTNGAVALPTLMSRDDRVELRRSTFADRSDILEMVSESVKRPVYLFFEPPRLPIPEAFRSLVMPAPARVFQYQREAGFGSLDIYQFAPSTYVKLGTLNQVPPPEKPVVIMRVRNPNGLEKMGQDDFFWIGRGYSAIEVNAARAGVLRLVAYFHMGPSLPEKPSRALALRTSGGYVAHLVLTGGLQSIDVPVLAGFTEVLLIPADLPSVTTQPNGDSRPLLLGVQGLRVGWLDKAGFCSVQLPEGWNGVERTGVHWLRWMGTRAKMRVFVSRETDLTLGGQFLSALSPNHVFLSVEGRTVATWEAPQRGFERRAMPATRIHVQAGETMIEFRSEFPAVQLPNDKRWLAVAVVDVGAAAAGLGDCQLTR